MLLCVTIIWGSQTKQGADLADGHLVGGQSASLVGADDGGAAEGLYRGQGAHDGVLLGHTSGSQSQAGGDDSRQSLRDGSHSQGHSNLEVVDGTLQPGASVSGVIEVSDVDGPHSHTHNGDHLQQQPYYHKNVLNTQFQLEQRELSMKCCDYTYHWCFNILLPFFP